MEKKIERTLIISQQKELNAVYMYQLLAKRVKNEDHKKAFLDLAKDEGRHASVFFHFTNKTLKPKKLLGRFVYLMSFIVSWRFLLTIIAKKEYDAFTTYEPVVKLFDEVRSVQEDEKRHGDIIMDIRTRIN